MTTNYISLIAEMDKAKGAAYAGNPGKGQDARSPAPTAQKLSDTGKGGDRKSQSRTPTVKLETFAVAELELIGARHKGHGDRGDRKSGAATIKDLGVTKDQSSEWQKLAAMPEEDSLLCELDSAIRRHAESLAQVEELKDRERVNV
ncbi:MAG TPA: hypothetical protein VKA02_03385 [Candidatus Acidoferrum sp.]|nr:hypothetical protein [Candidatus Acidoferrum sp.]